MSEMYIKILIYISMILTAFVPECAYALIGIMIMLLVFEIDIEEIKQALKSDKMLILMTLVIIFSSALSKLWYISVFFSMCFLMNVIFSFTVSKYISLRDVSKVFFIIIIIAIIVSVIGIFQKLTFNGSIPASWVDNSVYNINFRAYSTFNNPNVLSFYLSLSIIISVIWGRNCTGKFVKNTCLISGILSIICICLTYSRGSWISICIAFIVLSFMDRRYVKYAVVISFTLIFFDIFSGVFRMLPSNIKMDSSVRYRFELWKASFMIIKKNLIIGIGPGVLWDYILQYTYSIKPFVTHAHNLYIEILLDGGILAFLFFVGFISNIWNIISKDLLEDSFKGIISTISFTFYILILVNGIIDATCIQPEVSLFLWFFIGINRVMYIKK